jgi:hypothetical protein
MSLEDMDMAELEKRGIADIVMPNRGAFMAVDMDQAPKDELPPGLVIPQKMVLRGPPIDLAVMLKQPQAEIAMAGPAKRKRLKKQERKLRKVTKKLCDYRDYFNDGTAACGRCAACQRGGSITSVEFPDEQLEFSDIYSVLKRAGSRDKDVAAHGASVIYPPAFRAVKPSVVANAAIKQY